MYDVKTVKEELKSCKNVEDVIPLYENFYTHFSYRPDAEKFPIYKHSDVIDREKSVRWNEEEVTRRIVARTQEKARLVKLKNEISELYINTLIKLLAKEYRISKAEMKLIYSKAYEESHSYGIKEVLNSCRELSDLYEELKKASKSKED